MKSENKEKLLDDFWNQVHNPQKVSINLLVENDIETYEMNDDLIIVIHVPIAKREQKPVYINNLEALIKGHIQEIITAPVLK